MNYTSVSYIYVSSRLGPVGAVTSRICRPTLLTRTILFSRPRRRRLALAAAPFPLFLPFFLLVSFFFFFLFSFSSLLASTLQIAYRSPRWQLVGSPYRGRLDPVHSVRDFSPIGLDYLLGDPLRAAAASTARYRESSWN